MTAQVTKTDRGFIIIQRERHDVTYYQGRRISRTLATSTVWLPEQHGMYVSTYRHSHVYLPPNRIADGLGHKHLFSARFNVVPVSVEARAAYDLIPANAEVPF
jgi:hypothetical protein